MSRWGLSRWGPRQPDSRPPAGNGSVNVAGDNRGWIGVHNTFRDPGDLARIADLERALAQRENELHDAELRIRDLQNQRQQLAHEIKRSSGEAHRLDQLVREQNTTISLLSTALADKTTINGDIVRLRAELVKARRPRSRPRRRVGAGIVIVLAVMGACTNPVSAILGRTPPQFYPPDAAVTAPFSSAAVERTYVRCVRFASPVRLPRSLFFMADLVSDPAQDLTPFASTGIRSHFYLRITTTRRNVLYLPIDSEVEWARKEWAKTMPPRVFFSLLGQPHDATIKLGLVAVDEHTHQRLTARRSQDGYTRLAKATPAESICATTTTTWPVTAKAGG